MNFDEFVQRECPTLALPYGVTLAKIEAEFARDPDWPKVKSDPRRLHHLAETIHIRRLLERGEVPPTFTALRECSGCGPVLLGPWTPEKVEGCPWCLNRAKGLPIPRQGVAHG